MRVEEQFLSVEKQFYEMVNLLRSARAVCQRKGERTDWDRLDASIAKLGISAVTARVYILPNDDFTEADRNGLN